MSKRSTTGLPKPNQPKPEAAGSRSRLQPKIIHEYRSKAEREAEIQRLVILGTAIAVGIALIILVFAILNDQLLVPNQAVAKVNGTSISVSQFKKRATLERALLINELNNAIALFQSPPYNATSDQINQLITSQTPYSTWYGELQVADQLGNSVLNTMVEDELVRQKADELGITVSEDEIDAKIDTFFGYDPATAALVPTGTPSPTPSPTALVSPTPSLTPTATATLAQTMTPTLTPYPSATPSPTPNATERAVQFTSQRDDYFTSIRNQTGLGNSDIRDYFKMQALREKVRNAVLTDTSRTAPFVDARHILVADEATAQSVLTALQDGESFASLAQAVSTDSSASSGGELGWAPVSNYVTEFADAVRDAEIGAIIGPVQSQFGYHIIQVRAREDREMSDTELAQAQGTQFDTYLSDLRTADSTNIEIYDTWTNNVPTDPVWVPTI